MKQLEVCPCGIAKTDCEYHKPEQKEYSLICLDRNVYYTYDSANKRWTRLSNYPGEFE